jgi:hypothetical protein
LRPPTAQPQQQASRGYRPGTFAVRDAGLAAMKPILQRFGFSINSEGRTPGHNAEVGGKSNSYHIHGRALDVWHNNAATRARLKAFIDKNTPYEAIDEGDHIHIEPKG